MKTAPDPSLRAVQVAIAYNQDDTPYPVILFNDGSIWRQCVEKWHCVWPAPEAAERLHGTQVTLKPEELQLDDVIDTPDGWLCKVIGFESDKLVLNCAGVCKEISRTAVATLLARGFTVTREGEVISGWPVGETGGGPVQLVARNVDDVKRIADLESQIKAWKEAASIELVEGSYEPATIYETPDSLVSRLQELYRWASTAEDRAEKSESEGFRLGATLRGIRKQIPENFEDPPL